MSYFNALSLLAVAFVASAGSQDDRILGRPLTWDVAGMVPLTISGDLSRAQQSLISRLRQGETSSVLPEARRLIEKSGDMIAAWTFILSHKVRNTCDEGLSDLSKIKVSKESRMAVAYAIFKLNAIKYLKLMRGGGQNSLEYERLKVLVDSQRTTLAQEFPESFELTIAIAFDGLPHVPIRRTILESRKVADRFSNWIDLLKCRALVTGLYAAKAWDSQGREVSRSTITLPKNESPQPDAVLKLCRDLKKRNFEVGKVMYYEARALLEKGDKLRALEIFRACLKREDLTSDMTNTIRKYLDTGRYPASFSIIYDE